MRPEAEAAQRWLAYAESDHEVAALSPTGKTLAETLAFHAQQAGEKAMKAVLVSRGVDPPRTHNLQSVLALLPDDIISDRVLTAADILSPYAVASRYPGDAEPVTVEELATAVDAARDVLDWARRVVESQDA
jgi:HEPN domain-containing protein